MGFRVERPLKDSWILEKEKFSLTARITLAAVSLAIFLCVAWFSQSIADPRQDNAANEAAPLLDRQSPSTMPPSTKEKAAPPKLNNRISRTRN